MTASGRSDRDGAVHGVAIGDVEVGVIGRDDIVTGGLATAHEVDAELAARTGDEHAHLEAGPGLQRLPPGAVVAVPLDRRGQAIDEVVLASSNRAR